MKPLDEILNNYSNKHVTITGGLGYIGSTLSQLLHDNCASLNLTSRTTASHPKFNILPTDLQDKEVWQKIIDTSDIVFHLGGNTSLYAAERDPFLNLHQTLKPLHNLGEALSVSRKDIKIVYASNCYYLW